MEKKYDLAPKLGISIDVASIPDWAKIKSIKYLVVGGPSHGKIIEMSEHRKSWLVEFEGRRYEYHAQSFCIQDYPPLKDGIYVVMTLRDGNDVDFCDVAHGLFEADILPFAPLTGIQPV